MGLRSSVVWLLAAVSPLLVGGAIAYVHHVPAGVRARAIDLNGEWRILEGDAPASEAAGPDVDDEAWRTMRIPGPYAKQGFRAPDCWLRRTFELPALPAEPLFLILGDTRSSVSRIYVNGHPIGEKGIYDARLKVDLTAAEGWVVPVSVLREGRNVIAVQQRWLALQKAWVPEGFMDRRQLLGPASALKPVFVRAQTIDAFLRNGPVLLDAVLVLLMLALALVEWSTPNRTRYFQAIGLVAVTAAYVCLYSGLFTSWIGVGTRITLLYFAIACLCPAFLEFFEPYYRGAPRLNRINRIVWLAFLLAGPLTLPLRFSELTYTAMAVWLFVGVFYQAYMTLGDLRTQRSPLSPVLATAILTVIASGSVDLLTDLGLASAPRLFQPALAAMAIVLCMLVIGDFLSVYRARRELALSLERSNAELTEALAVAREATRVKGQFLATVSHELRTPLNAIINVPEGLLHEVKPIRSARCKGCDAVFEVELGERIGPSSTCAACGRSDILVEGRERIYTGQPERTAQHLEIIRRSGLNLLQLVEQILDMSSLESRQMTLAPEDVAASAVLDALRPTLVPLAMNRNVRIRCAVAGTDRTLRVDRAKLSQALFHLASNAVKFSHDDGRVEISGTDDGEGYRFDVVDHGIGIAPESHRVIFEAFRQGDDTETRRYGGSGLGLSLARELVALHGGTIHVRSALGEGSTFSIHLPASVRRPEGAAPKAQSDASGIASARET